MSIINNFLRRHAKIAVSAGLAAAMALSGTAFALADTGAPSGAGTLGNPYILTTAAQLAAIPTYGMSACYKLGNDIDLSWYSSWTPIGTSSTAFSGTLDGNGHSITGLTIGTSASPSTASYLGLFGYLSNASLKNVAVSETIYASTTASQYVGGLAGYAMTSTITNCTAAGTVAGDAYVGLLAGDVNGSTVSSCTSSGNASAYQYVGGLVGFAASFSYYSGNMSVVTASTLTSDSSSAAVACTHQNGGGLVGGAGYATSSTGVITGTTAITGCFATGDVTGGSSSAVLGGLAGYSGANISGSYATGAVAGYNDLGGLIGESDHGAILNDYATGNVSGTNNSVGGLIGEADFTTNQYVASRGGIANCYALGSVTGYDNVGGFAGSSIVALSNCYEAGMVDLAGGTHTGVGAFCGSYASSSYYHIGGSASDSYYDATVNTVVPSDSSGVGKATSDMQTQTFADLLNANSKALSIANAAAWEYGAAVNGGYPYLSGVGIGADTTPPTGTFSLSPSGSTSGPVIITLTAADSGSSVASITLPDGSVVSVSTATYTVTVNGTYSFTVADNAGNTARLSETVSNIVATSSDSGSSSSGSGSSSGSSSSSSSSSSSGSSSSGSGASSQTDTIGVNGTISASGISVTHPTSIAYTIDSSGNFTSPDFSITNNSSGPVSVTVESLQSASGGTLQFTDVAPTAEDWGNLDLAGSKTYIALGIGADTSTGWSSGVNSGTFWAVDTTPMAVGSIASGGSASLALTAHNGHVFDQSYTARHSLVLEFNLT